MFNFIEQLIEFTNEAESPEQFWRWSAIATLGSTLRDNIYLECPIGTIYPNLFIILYSDSGICRKANPCKFASKLIHEVGNTKLLAGRASMQAVVRELGKARTNDRGEIIIGASGLLYSEELSSFIVDDPVTIPLLIDLYDYHEEWSTNLISASSTLKNVCLSLFAATNSDLFNGVYTEKAIKGGLLGRTLIIKMDRPRHRKSLLDLGSIDEEKFKILINHLKKIGKLKGKIYFLADAQKEYNDWYYAIPDEIFVDRIGFGSRLGTHVLKVAIALAAAREDFNKEIYKKDVIEAIELCQGLRQTYKQLSFGIGVSTSSYQASIIIKAMIGEPNFSITRKKLIQRTFGDIDSVTVLDGLIMLMSQGGLIDEGAVGNEVGYRLTKKAIEMLAGGTNGNS